MIEVMGRPKGSKNKTTLEREAVAIIAASGKPAVDKTRICDQRCGWCSSGYCDPEEGRGCRGVYSFGVCPCYANGHKWVDRQEET